MNNPKIRTMKKLLNILALVFIAASVSGCYDDKSTVPDKDIPEIMIDASEAPMLITKKQGELLVLDVPVTREGAGDGDLTYMWRVTPREIMNPNYDLSWAPKSSSEWEVVSNENALEFMVNMVMNQYSYTYFVWLEVFDNVTKLAKSHLWVLVVNAGFKEGLIVVDTDDGTASDLNLIQGPLFTEYIAEEDIKTIYNIYSNRNGAKLDGLVSELLYSQKILTAMTDKALYGMSKFDYQLTEKGHDMFVDKDIAIRPVQILNNRQRDYLLVNGNDLYERNLGPGWSSLYPMTVRSAEPYTVSGRAASKQNFIELHPHFAFYDEPAGKFRIIHETQASNNKMGSLVELYSDHYDQSEQLHNPDDVPGMTVIWASAGNLGKLQFLMKEKATGKYFVYSLGTQTIDKVYEMPAGAQIANATHFMFCHMNNVIYYATQDKLYSIYLGEAGALKEKLIYTAAGGRQITHLSMYLQARYLRGSYDANNPIATNGKLLLLGVYNGSEGELLAIPTRDMSGNIDTDNITTFGGFDRILTVAAQE